MSNRTCYNCTERQLGCHGRCEKYLSYRKAKDKHKKVIEEARDFEDYLMDAIGRMQGTGRGIY